MRSLAALAAVTVALTVPAASYAVLGGSDDAGAHPAVGLLLVPGPEGLAPECSGVLVAPAVFLTAGHCTETARDAGGAYVVFGDTVNPASWSPLAGTAVTDPGYGAPGSDPHDLGVVLLSGRAPVEPASLPAAGADDGLAHDGVVPTSVGYGYSERAGAQRFGYDGVRHAASIPVVSQTGSLLRLLDPSGASLCFGDSGGPQFLPGTTTVAAITLGGSPSCHGTATATRLDTPSARGFLGTYLTLP
jgi:hypothetical protein